MSKPRTKMKWGQHETEWDVLPMVVLRRELYKQEWFTGTISFTGVTEQAAKRHFRRNPQANRPTGLYITQMYKDIDILIGATWNLQWVDTTNVGRCEVQLLTGAFGRSLRKKIRGSLYIEGVIERVKEAIDYASAVIEEDILEDKIQKEKRKADTICREELSEELGVALTSSGCGTFLQFQYGKDRKYGLRFEKTGDGEDEFSIGRIRGVFGKEEIKQLIKIVGGCPRAVASRLMKK